MKTDVITAGLNYVHLLSAGTLVGKVALLSFVVAPVLARQLDTESFGRVVRQLFPHYYAMGMLSASAGLIALGGLAFLRGMTTTVAVGVGLWLSVLGAETYCRSPLTPQSNAMRDRLKALQAEGAVDTRLHISWERLHRRSIYLNTLVLLAGLVLVGCAMVATH
ncbi:hypothetical protein YTPLAS18_01080 [Nitrospira sp.]|nr:hypothetical protein YTPLAS18_01080 [Nitrospira sp.]